MASAGELQVNFSHSLPDDDEPYTTARDDLAAIIAQETSGIKDALPEDDDYDLADEFIERINTRYNEGT